MGTVNFKHFATVHTNVANSIEAKEIDGGRDRDRTGDPLLAKQVLSQLSYTPTEELILILKHFPIFCPPLIMFFCLDRARTVQDRARFALPCRIACRVSH